MSNICKDPEITLVEAAAAVEGFKGQCGQGRTARHDAGIVTMHATELPVALQDTIDSLTQSRDATQHSSIFQIVVVALRHGNVVALRHGKGES